MEKETAMGTGWDRTGKEWKDGKGCGNERHYEGVGYGLTWLRKGVEVEEL